jgi:hypothetical protein
MIALSKNEADFTENHLPGILSIAEKIGELAMQQNRESLAAYHVCLSKLQGDIYKVLEALEKLEQA